MNNKKISSPFLIFNSSTMTMCYFYKGNKVKKQQHTHTKTNIILKSKIKTLISSIFLVFHLALLPLASLVSFHAHPHILLLNHPLNLVTPYFLVSFSFFLDFYSNLLFLSFLFSRCLCPDTFPPC